jgi:predicted PurR-regulated permease PerM
VIAQFSQFADSAPAYWARAQDLLQSLGKRFPQFAHTLNGELLGSRTTERIIQILSTARTFAMGTAAAVLGMVALAFILIFTILNPGPLVDGLLSLFPIAYVKDARTISKQISDKLTIWVEGTFITMFSVGLMCWLGLMILGVDFPVLFGIIAGLLEVIPTIGPVLSAIPPMAVALIDNPIKALYVAILYTAVQQVESNLLVPYVMSTKLRLHPLSLLFAILVLASLLGIFGALIATPTVAVIKVLYEEIYLNRVRDGLNSNNHSMNKE